MAGRRRDPDRDVLVARISGVLVIDGREETVTAGRTRARASHPIVKAAPDWWEPINVHYDLEEAVAEPGERRAG